MSKIFKFSNLNPFRWTEKNAVRNLSYNTLPFDSKIDNNYLNGPYFQKWQTGAGFDAPSMQFLSDWDLTLKFYKYNSFNSVFADTLYQTVELEPVIGFPITGVTFTAYEATVDFSTFAEGNYYGEVSYVDDADVTRVWQTSPLSVKNEHKGTLKYEYWDVVNTKGIIFSTGIRFCLRIEGNIRNYKPSSVNTEFEDQNYNTTTLDDIPYRVQSNFIGTAAGLPDWIIDKMNLIFSVKIKSIDGVFYNKVAGSKFDVTRPSQIPIEDGFLSIEIIQQDNFFIDNLITGDGNNEGDYVVIKRAKIYDLVGASFDIQNIFTVNTNLIRIALENKALDTFVLKVGTTAGANDIAEFEINGEATDSLDIGHVFNVNSTVYIAVPNGVNLKVTVDYNQYDAVNITPAPISIFPKGYKGMYEEVTPGDYDIAWNVTGMGNVGTPWEGCAISGTNGTKSMDDCLPIGWDHTLPLTRETYVGVPGNNIFITRGELPAEGLEMFTTDVNPTFGDLVTPTSNTARSGSTGGSRVGNYDMLKGTDGVEPSLGLTAKLGSGDPLVITPYSLITVFFVKIS